MGKSFSVGDTPNLSPMDPISLDDLRALVSWLDELSGMVPGSREYTALADFLCKHFGISIDGYPDNIRADRSEEY